MQSDIVLEPLDAIEILLVVALIAQSHRFALGERLARRFEILRFGVELGFEYAPAFAVTRLLLVAADSREAA